MQQDGLREQITTVQKDKQFVSWVHSVFTGTDYEESSKFAQKTTPFSHLLVYQVLERS